MSELEDSGTTCSSCGATLAADQRYCVECGQRRGSASLPFAPVAVVYEDSPADEQRPARGRMTTNAAFLGLVGVLLLALGVGVLIGRAGNASATKSSPPVQVVTVAAGASAPASGAAGTTGAAGASPAAAAGGAAAVKAAKVTTNAKSSTSVTTTATKVTAIETTRPLTGPNRPGYKNGKFTGNFFGP